MAKGPIHGAGEHAPPPTVTVTRRTSHASDKQSRVGRVDGLATTALAFTGGRPANSAAISVACGAGQRVSPASGSAAEVMPDAQRARAEWSLEGEPG
jgi:hypothetical protein